MPIVYFGLAQNFPEFVLIRLVAEVPLATVVAIELAIALALVAVVVTAVVIVVAL